MLFGTKWHGGVLVVVGVSALLVQYSSSGRRRVQALHDHQPITSTVLVRVLVFAF